MDAIKGTKRSLSFAAKARCRSCHGTGMKSNVQSHQRTCKSCGGSGEQVLSQAGLRFKMTCQTCGGAGTAFSKDDLCSGCGGQGLASERQETVVNIPAGVDTGERLRVSGKGHAGTIKGAAGDLYITLDVQKPSASEATFKRSGSDLIVDIPVPFYDAILGASVPVPTLDNQPATLKIPPGISSDFSSVIKGRGVQKLMKRDGTRGDLHVRVKIIMPDLSKTDEQTDKLRRLIQDYREIISTPGTTEAKLQDDSENSRPTDNFLKKTIGKIKDSLCDKDKEKKF